MPKPRPSQLIRVFGGGLMCKPATLIAAILFAIVAGAHLLRLVFHVGVTIGDWAVPTWVSVFALLVVGGLAVMLWRERHTD